MLSLGIIGLPNAGKSSLFKALTRVPVPIANYPFTTIEPHHGIVAVPDGRLEKLAKLTPDNKVLPTVIEFVDIAGLIRGAHKGEGLGNQFLSHIREVDGLVEVVRAFEEKTVPHPMESIDPERDIKVIDEELIQADLKILEQAIEKVGGTAKAGTREAQEKFEALELATKTFKTGTPFRDAKLSEEVSGLIREYNLLTAKPMLFVLNIGEKAATQFKIKDTINMPMKLYADLADLAESEATAMKKEFGIEEDKLQTLIRRAYELLDLMTFYTVKPPETRAWAIKQGTLLPEAGAAIHTDFKEKFIRAEVIHIDGLLESNSWQSAKSAGKVRTEGKEYIVRDGDVIEFKI